MDSLLDLEPFNVRRLVVVEDEFLRVPGLPRTPRLRVVVAVVVPMDNDDGTIDDMIRPMTKD